MIRKPIKIHMTMKKRTFIFAILPVLVLAGCRSDEIQVYDGPDNIYFLYKMWPTSGFGMTTTLEFEGRTLSLEAKFSEAQDSIIHSFAFVDAREHLDTTFIPVRLIGRLADHDRKIAYRINTATGAAAEGADFRVLDAFIPAGKTAGGIVVELSRDNLTEGRHLEIDFELLANENFGLEYQLIRRSVADTASVPTTTFRLWFNDELPPPPNWGFSYADFLGAWSPKKAYLLVEQFNITWDALYNPPHTAYIVSWGGQLKRYLARMAAEGHPVMEADGVTPMEAGPYA